MSHKNNQKSIKDSLEVIKKAIQDNATNNENLEKNVLLLNKLIKEDGTIQVIDDNFFKIIEDNENLKENLSSFFEKKIDNWVEKNLPKYVEKYLTKKNK
mgnify:CR=1 FL=1|tara:strand:- start:88 stop:384 length:297 start_codon:yes stop_codon:yes gene_type:complete